MFSLLELNAFLNNESQSRISMDEKMLREYYDSETIKCLMGLD